MSSIISLFLGLGPQDVLDIALLTLVIYRMLLLIKGTRTIPILMGLSVLLATYALSTMLGLEAIGYVMDNLFSSAVVILVVLFQTDIRNALARVGMTTMFREQVGRERSDLVAEVVKAAFALARRRIGGTIILEAETGLRNYIERGRTVNALPTVELIESIFHTSSPLHDGAIIITREGRLAAARCILPLTTSVSGAFMLGTRHRSAIGITEETDALAVVVSEERSEVSLAYQGVLHRNLDETELRRRIREILIGNLETHGITEASAKSAKPKPA